MEGRRVRKEWDSHGYGQEEEEDQWKKKQMDKTISHWLYCYRLTQHCFQSHLQCESKKGRPKEERNTSIWHYTHQVVHCVICIEWEFKKGARIYYFDTNITASSSQALRRAPGSSRSGFRCRTPVTVFESPTLKRQKHFFEDRTASLTLCLNHFGGNYIIDQLST